MHLTEKRYLETYAKMDEKGQNFMDTVISFCDAGRENAAFLDLEHQNEELIHKGLTSSSEYVIRKTVPKQFWDQIMSEPKVVKVFCPALAEKSAVIVLLLLWSHSSTTCHHHIVNCLRAGKKNWHTGNPMKWIRWYLYCAQVNIMHQRNTLRITHPDYSDVELDALSLNEAVKNSTALFSVLTNQSPNKLVSEYTDFLNTLPSEESTCTPLRWYKDNKMLPTLKTISQLTAVENLTKGIMNLKNDEKGVFKKVEKLTKEATHSLSISKDLGVTLLGFAMFVNEAVHEPSNIKNTKREDLLMTPIILAVGEFGEYSHDKTVKTVKDLMEMEHPVIDPMLLKKYIDRLPLFKHITDDMCEGLGESLILKDETNLKVTDGVKSCVATKKTATKKKRIEGVKTDVTSKTKKKRVGCVKSDGTQQSKKKRDTKAEDLKKKLDSVTSGETTTKKRAERVKSDGTLIKKKRVAKAEDPKKKLKNVKSGETTQKKSVGCVKSDATQQSKKNRVAKAGDPKKMLASVKSGETTKKKRAQKKKRVAKDQKIKAER
jgi:hypothetical protein